jgi:hypothetical protein
MARIRARGKNGAERGGIAGSAHLILLFARRAIDSAVLLRLA